MPYQVKSGDSLSAIAAAHGLSLQDLLAANPTLRGNPNLINVGQRLILPGDDASAVPQRGWVLGRLSEKYETGGCGPGTISSGQGDFGGVSYGSYQMSSQPSGGTVTLFVARPDFPWRDDFSGLVAGAADFSDVWRRVAQQASETFQQVQHLFIQQTHYEPLAAKIAAEESLDVNQHSPAIQDVVWSTAVQHGPNNAVIHRAAAQMRGAGSFDPTGENFDRDLIVAIYEERGRTDDSGTLVYFKSSSPAVQEGVKRRYQNEQQDALAMLA